jgi:hypothetical protein
VTTAPATASAPGAAIYGQIAPQRSTFHLYVFSRTSLGYLSYVAEEL